MAPVSETTRIAALDGLLGNIASGGDNRRDASRIVEAAKASRQDVALTALQLIEAGVCATTDEQCQLAYAQSPGLQREFPSAEAYIAYRRHDRNRAASGR